jgi:hypothetical protein
MYRIHANLMLSGKDRDYASCPTTRWYQQQREAVANEAWLHAMVKVAGCDRVLQHGCDETALDRISTYAQWALLETNGAVELVTIEAGGLLMSKKAEMQVSHIGQTWQRRQDAVIQLREKLGPLLADKYVPIRGGGMKLLKIRSTMNNTENTAKKVARLLTGKVKESGEAEYGEAGWKTLPSSHTMCLSYLCGNHARGLLITQFQRLFQKMLLEKLGAEFICRCTKDVWYACQIGNKW